MSQHRTVTFIRMYRDSSDEYVDRARRFAESLNGDNIKSEVVTVGENGAYADGFVPRDVLYEAYETVSDETLRAFAAEQGFVSSVIFDDVQDVTVKQDVETSGYVDGFEMLVTELLDGILGDATVKAIPLPAVVVA